MKSLRFVPALIVVFATALACSDVGARIVVRCPVSISMQPAVINDAPIGWQANQRSTVSFVRGASISIGPPEELGDLKPEIRTSAQGKIFSGKFVPADNDAGLWLSCGYENTVALFQRLPKGISRCSAILSTNGDGYPELMASCQ